MKTFFQQTLMSRNTCRIVRWTLGLIFLYAGISKLADPEAFAVIIEAYGLIPESWLMPVAVGLPALEVIAALGLMADIRGSLDIIAGLTVLFMAILGYAIHMGLDGYAIHMGLDVDCGCFGPEDPESRAFSSIWEALYRDMGMVAGIVYLYIQRFVRSAPPARPGEWFYKFFRKRSEKNA